MEEKMKRSWKVIALLLAVFMLFGASVSPAYADEKLPPPANDCKNFYLLAAHGINGERLGLDSALPVDVYVNGGYAFTFEFKDTVTAMLPAGNYTIDVALAGTDTFVMSLGPVDLEGCTKVRVVAKLVDGTPTLLARIRELPTVK
jgi:hypothetical protein